MAASKRHTGRNVGITFLALVVLLVGAGAGGVYLYSDKAKPGTSVAGRDVSGLSGVELAGVVSSMVDSFTLTLTGESGQKVTAKPADLGLSFDQAATIAQAVTGGGRTSPLSLYNPWEPKSVSLVYTLDDATAQRFLDQHVVGGKIEPKDASVSFDKKASAFAVKPGVIGKTANLGDLKAALADAATGHKASDYPVATVPTPPAVSDEMAGQAAASANAAMKLALKFTGPKGTYRVPAASIASWTSFAKTDGGVGVVYDEAAITKELPPALTKALVKGPIDQTYLTDPKGNRIVRVTPGTPGMAVTKAAAKKAVTSTLAALTSGTALTQAVKTEKANFKTVEKVVPHNYNEPNGAKWIDVDLTHQRTTLYKGTTKVKSYLIASGKRPLVTTSGTWYVWYKTPMQDMKGPGYLAKDVRWISFFHNGEGFHAAPWVYNFGVPHSHGCINMTTGAAKQLYDWAPLGTMVKVHGTTP